MPRGRTTTLLPDGPAKIDGKWLELFALIPGYDPVASASAGDWFDPTAAQRAIDFFPECLQHVEGAMAGQPFLLEPWEQAIVACIFGWKRQDGSRRYREAFIYVARGNGKTPFAAGIALEMLFCDNEYGAQIYLVASESEQASLSYRHASGMVEREPELNARARVFKGAAHRSIMLRNDPASTIRVVSSDAGGKHGFNPHCVIGDELHAWPHRDLLDALQTAFAKKGRRQPLLLWITTADYDRESPCNDKYAYACAVRDNGGDRAKPGYDPAFLPVIYEASVEDDWTDESAWEKANPNLDVTVDRTSLRRECERAQQQPAYEAEFKRLHLNIRTSSQRVYIPLERWDRCAGVVNLDSLRGKPCYGAFDISSRQDVTAFVLVFPPTDATGPFQIAPYFWIPEEGMRERERVDRVPYSVWVKQGLVFTCPGNIIDEDAIEKFIVDLRNQRFDIKEIAFDKWNAQWLATRLTNEGLTMVDIPQTIGHLTAGTKALDDLSMESRIAHGGNPVLRWMLSCTDVVGDKNQNLRPVKPDRKTGKRIDGVVATIMALSRALLNDVPVNPYDTRGLIWA